MKISIIIPALNEEKYLPVLLDSLDRQSLRPYEIIVADGFSKDKTRAIAAARGCLVVDGPDHPGTGRNRGAAAATGDVFIFIDADIVLPDNFLEGFMHSFTSSGAVCATGIYAPLGGSAWEKFCYTMGNFFIYAVQKFSPFAAGYFIAVTQTVFAELGGFDETLLLCEDHDLVKRASRLGKFRVFRRILYTSTRRYSEKGKLELSLFYFMVTAGTIFGKKYKRNDSKVKYEFGHHQ